MYTATITRRTRNLGFAVSNTPTGNGTEIAAPTAPRIVGTPGVLVPQAEPMRRSYGAPSAFTSTRWFLGGQPIRWSSLLDLCLAELAAGSIDSVEVEVEGDPHTKRPAAGRPETGTVITVRIPDEVIAACDAQPEGRAEFIRLAVEQELASRRRKAEHTAQMAADEARWPYNPAWRPAPGDRVVLRWRNDIGYGDAPEAIAPQWTVGVVQRLIRDGALAEVVLEPWCDDAHIHRTIEVKDLRPAPETA